MNAIALLFASLFAPAMAVACCCGAACDCKACDCACDKCGCGCKEGSVCDCGQCGCKTAAAAKAQDKCCASSCCK